MSLRRHWLAFLVLVSAWGLYAGSLLSPASNLYLTDTFSQDVPLRIFAARTIRDGCFPDWTSLVHCGWPIFADSQTGIFYPFFMLYVLEPSPEMHDIFMALHFLLAGCFMFAYLLQRELVPLAAAIGAITFMGGSYFQTTHIVPGVLAVGCWLPLAMLLIDRAANGGRSALWWLALVNSLVLLGGHMQVALISFTLEAIYFLWRVGIFDARRVVVGYSLAFILPVIIASVQIVPTFWYNIGSTRMSGVSSGLSWEQFSGHAIQQEHLWTFLSPDHFGDPAHYSFPEDPYDVWEETLVVFQGYAAIALLPLGILFGRPRRDSLFWACLLVVALLISTASPIYRIFYSLPVYSWFRWPARYMLLASFACSVLSALGSISLSNWLESRFKLGQTTTLLVLALATTAGLHRSMDYFTTGSDFYTQASPVILAEKRESRHFRLLPAARALFGYHNANEEQLRQNTYFLPVSYNMLFGVAAAPLFDQGNAVTPREMHEVLSCKSSNALRIAAVTHLSSPVPPSELSEIERYIHSVPIPDPSELEVLATDPCYVARFVDALPRAWMVYRTQLIDNREKRLTHIDSTDFDPSEVAIVERTCPELISPSEAPSVQWEEPSPGEIIVNVTTDRDGLLVVADTYHPDISATLDGELRELLRVNHAFRGILVPKGKHEVRMVYQVSAFYVGIALSVCGLLAVSRGIWRSQSVRRQTSEDAEPEKDDRRG